ncbi:MAG: hypothetical protein RL736_353 [Pseudomonadota bacterium]
MELQQLLNTKELAGLNLEIMFGAVPRNLVADNSKKFNKRKTKNLFYIIFGVFLKESNQYIVFSSIFKSKRKSTDDSLFEEIMVDSAVYEDEQDVLNHIYDFINSFSEHDRYINEEIAKLEMMPAQEAFNYLVLWNKGVFDYFNDLLKTRKIKKNGLFNLFK